MRGSGVAAPGVVVPSLLVMGAGSVGCFVGGSLQAAGATVHYVGRRRVLDALRVHGLTLTDLEGQRKHLSAEALWLSETVPAIQPSLVLLTVKSSATRAAAAELGRVLPAGRGPRLLASPRWGG